LAREEKALKQNMDDVRAALDMLEQVGWGRKKG
jgi:hypothetical protein